MLGNASINCKPEVTLFPFSQFQMLHECPMDLESLSSVVGQPLINGSNLNLNVIYKSALLSSAHFRYMAEDWKEGNSCLNSHEDDTEMRQAFERYCLYFLYVNCLFLY